MVRVKKGVQRVFSVAISRKCAKREQNECVFGAKIFNSTRSGNRHQAAAALLAWDQEVYMPPKGAQARGEQLATLSAMAHRLFTGDEMGGLIASLQEDQDSLDDDMTCLLRETAYDYERARKLPESLCNALPRNKVKPMRPG